MPVTNICDLFEIEVQKVLLANHQKGLNMLTHRIWLQTEEEFDAFLATFRVDDITPPQADTENENRQWAWALSGGGAKGTFQLGVILQLRKHPELWPKGISSTSIGSVNALALAQGYIDGVRTLQKVWLQVQSKFDAFKWAKWLDDREATLGDIREHAGKSLMDSFNSRPEIARRRITNDAPETLGWLKGFGAGLLGEIDDIIEEVGFIIEDLHDKAKGIYTFEPLEALIEQNINWRKIEQHGLKLRLCSVCLTDGNRYYFDQMQQAHCFAIPDYYTRHSSYKQRPDGLPDFVFEQTAVPAGQSALERKQIYLTQAVIASASVPFVNEPIPLWFASHNIVDPANSLPLESASSQLSDTGASIVRLPNYSANLFVDGGVRDVLPVTGANHILQTEFDHGPKGMITIGAGTLSPPMNMSEISEVINEGTKSFLTRVAASTLNLAIDEIGASEREEARRGGGYEYLEIYPSFEVGTLTDIDPGLVQIQLAYGFMTAFDVLERNRRGMSAVEYANSQTRLWYSTNRIAALRYKCWQLEQKFYLNFWHNPIWKIDQYFGASYIINHPEYFDYAEQNKEILEVEWDEEEIGDNPNPEFYVLRIPYDPRTTGTVVKFRDTLDEDIREIKRQIRNEVAARVATWGIESLPSPHDMSDLRLNNMNAVTDWWSEFERHGWHRAYSTKAPARTFYQYPLGAGWNNIAEGRDIQGPEGELQHDGFFWVRHPDAEETLRAKRLKLERNYTPWHIPGLNPVVKPGINEGIHRTPDYCAVRMEGFAGDEEFGRDAPWAQSIYEWFDPEQINHFLANGNYQAGTSNPRRVQSENEFRIVTDLAAFLEETGLTENDMLPLVHFRATSGLRHDDYFTTDCHEMDDTWVVPNAAYIFASREGYEGTPIGYIGSPSSERAKELMKVPLTNWFDPKRIDSRLTANPEWQI